MPRGPELRRVTAPPSPPAMDTACESPVEKGGETGASDETAPPPGGSGATDADGIPEETDGDAEGDLKEAAAEEGEVGREGLRPGVLRDGVCRSAGFLAGPF